MLDDIAGELLKGGARFVGYVLWEFFVEFLVRGVGYLICRIFRRDVDFDGWPIIFVGIVFWIMIFVLAITIILVLDR